MSGLLKNKQHGLSLSGLLFFVILAGMVAVLGMQVGPAVIEYQSIKKAAADACNQGSSVLQVRDIYNKAMIAGYFSAVSAADLDIVSKGDGKYAASFEYEKKIKLFGPVSLVIDFAGSTDGR
jgi:hypothetical protein